MSEKQNEILQKLGEDSAYTFKGLYKTSDWLELQYKLYLSFPIMFSIVSIGFDTEIPSLYIKLMAVISLIFTFLALLNQQSYEKIKSYRTLADEFKKLYDDLEYDYGIESIENVKIYRDRIAKLRKETTDLSISFTGRFLSKRKIKKEMNLKWLGGEYK